VIRVLEGWHTDPVFLGPYGIPKDLPFDSADADSFSGLVRKHSGDMAPRAMLDELLRVGAVEQTNAGTFRVLVRVYIPKEYQADALERFGQVVRDFVNTYEHNMNNRPGLRRFEQIVFADDGLREDLMPAFDALLRAKGHRFLLELQHWLTAQESPQTVTNKLKKRIKTGVGVYHFISEE
jgi:hypothetical protein